MRQGTIHTPVGPDESDARGASAIQRDERRSCRPRRTRVRPVVRPSQGATLELDAVGVMEEGAQIASAGLGSPMTACQSVTGSWLAMRVEARSARSSMTSVRSRSTMYLLPPVPSDHLDLPEPPMPRVGRRRCRRHRARSTPETSASPADCSPSAKPGASPSTSAQPARPNGSSTRSGHSPVPNRSSTTSAATPTGSPSATSACAASRRRRRALPLHRLPQQRRLPPEDHDAGGDRVHPPHAAARAPARLPPHPLLRLSSPIAPGSGSWPSAGGRYTRHHRQSRPVPSQLTIGIAMKR